MGIVSRFDVNLFGKYFNLPIGISPGCACAVTFLQKLFSGFVRAVAAT